MHFVVKIFCLECINNYKCITIAFYTRVELCLHVKDYYFKKLELFTSLYRVTML